MTDFEKAMERITEETLERLQKERAMAVRDMFSLGVGFVLINPLKGTIEYIAPAEVLSPPDREGGAQ